MWCTVTSMACLVEDVTHSPGRLRKGMCRKHYERAMKHGDPLTTLIPARGMKLSERFNLHVDRSGPAPSDPLAKVGTNCWVWTGGLTGTGYGKYSVRSAGILHQGAAHRWSYRMARGPIPDGMTIDHLCRNRVCVRPDHLEAVPILENLLRSPLTLTYKNTAKTHCKNGHEFTEKNTYRRLDRNGRDCKTCRRARHGRKVVDLVAN